MFRHCGWPATDSTVIFHCNDGENSQAPLVLRHLASLSDADADNMINRLFPHSPTAQTSCSSSIPIGLAFLLDSLFTPNITAACAHQPPRAAR